MDWEELCDCPVPEMAELLTETCVVSVESVVSAVQTSVPLLVVLAVVVMTEHVLTDCVLTFALETNCCPLIANQ